MYSSANQSPVSELLMCKGVSSEPHIGAGSMPPLPPTPVPLKGTGWSEDLGKQGSYCLGLTTQKPDEGSWVWAGRHR